jgi:type II secretory pathway pseudopilin PulG
LATMAIPQYIAATERAKSGKARNALGLISQAEKLYRADKDTYLNVANKAALVPPVGTPGLNDYVELSDITKDLDWNYTVTGASPTLFTATATRLNGSDTGTITLLQDGTWGGTRKKKVGGETP